MTAFKQSIEFTFVEETESEEVGETDQEKKDDDDVITLPGGPDDPLDVEYLANKLGMTELNDADADLAETDEGMINIVLYVREIH